MRNVYPESFKIKWREPGVKKASISDIKRVNNWDCENCGGAGYMSTFIGRVGPLKDAGNMGEISAFLEGSWWIGEHFTDDCPVCKGTGKEPGYVEQPVKDRTVEVSKKVDEWTDV